MRSKEEINEDILRGKAITEEEFMMVKDEWIGIPVLVREDEDD